jgi:hypothetical protein
MLVVVAVVVGIVVVLTLIKDMIDKAVERSTTKVLRALWRCSSPWIPWRTRRAGSTWKPVRSE